MYCTIITLILLNGTTWEFRDLNDFRNAGKDCKKEEKCLKEFKKLGKDRYEYKCGDK